MWEMESISAIALQKISYSSACRDDWVDILDLCNHHHIPNARSLAIQHISVVINGVEKVLMGRKYRVKSWLKDGLYDLVEQDASFSDEEADQLGFKTISKLYRIRELRLKHGRSYSGRSTVSDIKTEFEGELKEIADEDREPAIGRISPLFDLDTDGYYNSA
jgi:hypothetical protein